MSLAEVSKLHARVDKLKTAETKFTNIEPGAEIFVPKNELKKSVSASEIVGISSVKAFMVVIILNLVK